MSKKKKDKKPLTVRERARRRDLILFSVFSVISLCAVLMMALGIGVPGSAFR